MRTESDSFNVAILSEVRRSTKDRFVRLLMEADDQGLAFAESRGSQIAARADDQLCERRVVRSVLLHIEVNDVLALGGVNVIRLSSQRQRLICVDCRFLGVLLFFHSDVGVRKKLLRLSASRSAR